MVERVFHHPAKGVLHAKSGWIEWKTCPGFRKRRVRMNMEEKLPRKTEKPWGYELLWAFTPKYAGKILFVKKGQRLSLQYHEQKDESMYMYSGKVRLEISDENNAPISTTFSPGQTVRLAPFTRHRIEAIEDSLLLEVSTPELEDVVRLSDDYGRVRFR